MQIYQHDAMMKDYAREPEYVVSYSGFLMGRDYETPRVFSSRRVDRGSTWPNSQVRLKWKVLREVQFNSVPGAPT